MWISEMSDLNKLINEWEKSYLNIVRSIAVSSKYLFLISLLIPTLILPFISMDELVLAVSLITGLIGVVSVFVFVVNLSLIIDDHVENTRTYFSKLIDLLSVVTGREAIVKIQDLYFKTPYRRNIYIKYTPIILVAGFTALLFTTHHLFMILTLIAFNAITAVFLYYSLILFNNHAEWEVGVVKMLKDLVKEGLNDLVEPVVFVTNPFLLLVLSIATFTLYPVAHVTLRFNQYYGEHISTHRRNHLVFKNYIMKTLRL